MQKTKNKKHINNNKRKKNSPTEKYLSKINRCLNHLRSNKEVTTPQSKWCYKNPIDSRLSTYTSTLKVTPPASITHSLQPQKTQHTNVIHTSQQIEVTTANHQPKNFFNIKKLTVLNILPPSKLSDIMVTPKNTKASKNSNTNNQHKSKARNKPKQNEWEIQRTQKFRTQTIQKKMVQTKLI